MWGRGGELSLKSDRGFINAEVFGAMKPCDLCHTLQQLDPSFITRQCRGSAEQSQPHRGAIRTVLTLRLPKEICVQLYCVHVILLRWVSLKYSSLYSSCNLVIFIVSLLYLNSYLFYSNMSDGNRYQINLRINAAVFFLFIIALQVRFTVKRRDQRCWIRADCAAHVTSWLLNSE